MICYAYVLISIFSVYIVLDKPFVYIALLGALGLIWRETSSYVIYIILGSACLSSNDEINGDTRIIFNLYVAEEDIPLPKGIPIDIKAKEPKLNPRSPPYGPRNYMPKKR